MGDRSGHIEIAVNVGIHPALGLRLSDFGKDPFAFHNAAQVNHTLHQCRRCGDRLEGRSRCRFLIGGLVDQGLRKVLLKRAVIIRIHAVCHFVIVVARVRNHGKHITGIYVRDDDGAGARIKIQLIRCQIHSLNPVHHEGHGTFFSADKTPRFFIRYRNRPLLHQNLTDLRAGNCIALDHVMKQMLGEVFILFQLLQNIIGKSNENLRAGSIFLIHADFSGIDPVHGNGIIQELGHRDHFIRGPADVRFILGVNAVADQYLIVLQHLNNVAFIVLVFRRKHIVRLLGRQHFILQPGEGCFPIGFKG